MSFLKTFEKYSIKEIDQENLKDLEDNLEKERQARKERIENKDK